MPMQPFGPACGRWPWLALRGTAQPVRTLTPNRRRLNADAREAIDVWRAASQRGWDAQAAHLRTARFLEWPHCRDGACRSQPETRHMGVRQAAQHPGLPPTALAARSVPARDSRGAVLVRRHDLAGRVPGRRGRVALGRHRRVFTSPHSRSSLGRWCGAMSMRAWNANPPARPTPSGSSRGPAVLAAASES